MAVVNISRSLSSKVLDRADPESAIGLAFWVHIVCNLGYQRTLVNDDTVTRLTYVDYIIFVLVVNKLIWFYTSQSTYFQLFLNEVPGLDQY